MRSSNPYVSMSIGVTQTLVGLAMTFFYTLPNARTSMSNGEDYLILLSTIFMSLFGLIIILSHLDLSKIFEEKRKKALRKRSNIEKIKNKTILPPTPPIPAVPKHRIVEKQPHEEPWNHKWFVVGPKKKWGPYSFARIVKFVELGKVSVKHRCHASPSGSILLVGDIAGKKKTAAM